MLGGGGGQCLCEREAGLRDAARENGNNVIRVALRRKATSMRCSYTCNVVSQQSGTESVVTSYLNWHMTNNFEAM